MTAGSLISASNHTLPEHVLSPQQLQPVTRIHFTDASRRASINDIPCSQSQMISAKIDDRLQIGHHILNVATLHLKPIFGKREIRVSTGLYTRERVKLGDQG
jgi:hypothetical protein